MDAAAVAERFERFAFDEAIGRSALYADWAAGVASDLAVQEILVRIPAERRQPPLVFAVTRMLGAPEDPYRQWREWLIGHADAVVAECSRRTLQTNDPLRCAALLPALSGLEGPLALLEVGASAGLCLYPDRYSYRYRGGPALDPHDGVSPVVLESAVHGRPPLRLPDVIWRAGIDLAPLDASDAADRRFLLSLVWPGEQGRAQRIEAALDLVCADPPLLVRGDATVPGALEELAASAPSEATLVVTTPGVLPHIPRAGRDRLRSIIAAMDAVWVSIDPPMVHRQWNRGAERDGWDGFVLTRDGAPLATVDPLGASVEWRTGGASGRR
ncbi:DUF2332 domain-containing protein [Microbacterium sp. zg.B48]|uniref:DUF2332 domain-containing protein n=1 Tax=Microbacterium sp. zg.B48 TaxID=2969408 RepID=UPI00214D02B2|nr:DUF2332 domain-containing protein [Microbacterium sp. zg.B48]MCR2762526.1 DUF2332 domain-containing protein [Microbacterium sp. zg.B48]